MGHQITKDKFLDKQERGKLLRACKERAQLDLFHGRITWPKRYMLVDLALFSGLRVSELTDLRVGDLELKAKDPYLTVRNGKGGKKRNVYLSAGLAKRLREYLTYKKDSLGEDTDPEAYLFPGRDGGRASVHTAMQSWKQAVREAGLPRHYSIHCARHTYATYLLHTTGQLRYVQKQLGHASINSTAVYADILPEENGRLANMIEDEV